MVLKRSVSIWASPKFSTLWAMCGSVSPHIPTMRTCKQHLVGLLVLLSSALIQSHSIMNSPPRVPYCRPSAVSPDLLTAAGLLQVPRGPEVGPQMTRLGGVCDHCPHSESLFNVQLRSSPKFILRCKFGKILRSLLWESTFSFVVCIRS